MSNSFNSIKKLKAKLIYQPSNFILLNEVAGLYFNSKDYSNSIKYYELSLKTNRNAITLSNLGIAYQLSLNFSKAAESFLESIELDPNYFSAHINLGNLFGSLGKHDLLLKHSLNALGKWPHSSEIHSNIGVALMGLGHHKEAKISLQTAFLLDEKSIDALFNMASIESFEGNHAKAIEYFESILEKPANITEARIIQSKHSLAYEYLRSGRLTEGWEYYEHGFDPLIPHEIKRNPVRHFSVPKWTGNALSEEIILVWGEQGIGDEILFSSIFSELINDGLKIIIECQSRLVNIFQRSFPSTKVRATTFDTSDRNYQTIFDYNYHIPMGSLNKIYRNNINSFKNSNSNYLITDKKLNEKYFNRLSGINEKLKIGIIWRSGLLNPLRNIHYTQIFDWGPIFELENVAFINLQYGECEEELIQAEKIFNIKIHRWSDVDLKNDLDDVISIVENLDLVIGPCTATTWLAAGIGKPTLLFQQKDWINFGQDYFPYNNNVKSFFPKQKGKMAETLLDIRNYIDRVFNSGN
jgi:tetratricopeptide (TPR) repeat protein